MRYLIIVFFTMITGISSSCNGQKSKLIDFQYQGYSDTIYAVIYGQILQIVNDKETPLDSVEIVSYKPEPSDTITYSDKEGSFSMGFCKGIFSVELRKKGFQSIRLLNYESDPDQISKLKAILRKGDGEIVYDLKKYK